jgi:hypothetical protein
MSLQRVSTGLGSLRMAFERHDGYRRTIGRYKRA